MPEGTWWFVNKLYWCSGLWYANKCDDRRTMRGSRDNVSNKVSSDYCGTSLYSSRLKPNANLLVFFFMKVYLNHGLHDKAPDNEFPSGLQTLKPDSHNYSPVFDSSSASVPCYPSDPRGPDVSILHNRRLLSVPITATSKSPSVLLSTAVVLYVWHTFYACASCACFLLCRFFCYV